MSYYFYTFSNADLCREVLNAVAAICSSGAFKGVLYLGGCISIIMTVVTLLYSERASINQVINWFLIVLFVFVLLMKTTVTIINTSDQSDSPKVVDGVPIGLAAPIYVFTSLAHSLGETVDEVFALPDDMQYQKTGMLFGSHLFNLSLRARIEDPDFKAEMNDFIKSCVIGDMTINKKYTLKEVLHSEDIWGLITSKPSPIRGMYINGEFKTCKDSVTYLDKKLTGYAETDAIGNMATKLGTKQAYSDEAVRNALSNSYSYFSGAKYDALSIMRQNLMINAYRSGMKNYAKETGAAGVSQIISDTDAMMKTRETWSTITYLGKKIIPNLEMALLLLILSLFPFIAPILFLPGLGVRVYKNFITCILWIESFQFLYAVLNMIVNFSLKATEHKAVTLSNVNLLAQQHSDLAGVAGAMIISIPVLVIGIIKGGPAVFGRKAEVIGGQSASVAQGSAAAAASGNLSYGNVSTDNATANNRNFNKHDTNFTDMHGGYTEQMDNGSLVTTNRDGGHVYNVSPGMSNLATHINAAHSTATSLLNQAEGSLASAFNSGVQYNTSKSHGLSLGDNYSDTESSQTSKAMNDTFGFSESVAHKIGSSSSDVFKKLSQAAISGELNTSTIGSVLGIKGSISAMGQSSSIHDVSVTDSTDETNLSNQLHNFSEGINYLMGHAKTSSLSDQNSEQENLAIQTGASLADANRLSASAQNIETNSDSFNQNFSQMFAEQYERDHPLHSQSILSATGNTAEIKEQEESARKYIAGHAEELAHSFEETSKGILSGDGKYDPYGLRGHLMDNYHSDAASLSARGSGLGVDGDREKSMKERVNREIMTSKGRVNASSNELKKGGVDAKYKARKEILKAGEGAKKSISSQLIDDTSGLFDIKEDPWVWKD